MLVFLFSALELVVKLGRLAVSRCWETVSEEFMSCDCVARSEREFLTMAIVGLLLTLERTEQLSLF